MKPSRKVVFFRYILPILILVAVLSRLGGYFHHEIFTYYWHLKNGNTIEWNGLKVEIPDDLISENSKDPNSKDIVIFSRKNASKMMIWLSITNWKSGDGLKGHLESLGYKILKNEGCSWFSNQCFHIKSQIIEHDKEKFRADILGPDGILISFSGIPAYENNFFRILDSIRSSSN